MPFSSSLVEVGAMSEQQKRIRAAYDLTAEQHQEGIDPLESVPEKIRCLPGYDEIVNNRDLGSSAADIKEYLKPETGMRFLDAGCCANIANYRFDTWPGTYYGVDISGALIEAMMAFVRENGIEIGGLYNTDLANMPFDDDFFDVAAAIGVLEYYTMEYSERALQELHRVLRASAKLVVDLPNLDHPHVETVFRLEEHLGRPNTPKERKPFENFLKTIFDIDRVDDSRVMLKYFVRAAK